MNIGSVELHGGGSSSFPHSDGELSVDHRPEGLSRDNSNEKDASSSLKFPLKTSGLFDQPVKKPLNDAVAEKPTKPDSNSKQTEEKKKRRKKKWKKPKDKPNRPLSAYNLFFASERAKMLGDKAPTPEQEALKKRIHCRVHGVVGFGEMARTIGAKWKALEPEKKKVFEDMARKEKDRYQVELATWKLAQKNKSKAESSYEGAGVVAPGNVHASSMLSNRMNLEAWAAKNSLNMSMQGTKPTDSSMRFLLENGIDRRNISNLQPSPHADYIRNMRDRPIDQSALFGMSSRQFVDLPSVSGPSFQQQQYPSAAEASANTLLNHFQQGYPQGSSSQLQATSQPQNLVDRQLFQEFAAMKRLQQQQQQQLLRQQQQLQMQQQQLQMRQQMNNMSRFNGMGGFSGGMNGM
mmetsp:Transcript_20539/g.38435  ORF Transcript_20539/g.38435 Transcript_20539/m.38435 type:complete len:406 (-) Transcript_20539:131-1348(-)